MKYFLSTILCLSTIFCFSQNTQQTILDGDSYSTFRILVQGGIGYGKIENETAPNYNLNLDYFEALINYRFSEQYGIATGVGINEFSGNGFNAFGNFYHEREELKIPLLATADYNVNEKIRAIVGLGLYGKTNLTDDYRFLNNVVKDVYEDWNFGFQGNFSVLFMLTPNYSFGLNFNFQNDFSKIKANPGQPISGEQRMENVSALGIMIMMQF
jgi:hypothetical protein